MSQQTGGNRGEIKSLTGLRGLAACLVMLYHYEWRIRSGPVNTFYKHGYLAVDLFFILSGFVMAMTYAKAFKTDFSMKNYRTFLFMRIGRVYPLYLTTTALYLALSYANRPRVPLRTIISNALLVQSWGIASSIVGPGWSISTEFAAYLLFPCLLCILNFGRLRTACVSAAAASFILAFIAFQSTVALHQIDRNGPLDVYGISIFPMLRCLAGFMLGLFAWRVAAIPRVLRIAEHPVTGTCIAFLVLLALAVPKADVLIVFSFFLLIIAFATEKSSLARLVGSRGPYWLGLISYSIYLVHDPILFSFQQTVNRVLIDLHIAHAFSVAGLILVLSILTVSVMTYYLIEKPGRQLARRLMRN